MKKKLILIFAALLAIGAIVFYLQWNKPHRDPAKEDGIKITAEMLFTEYEQNEAESNNKYLNKTLEINGTIVDVGSNQGGEPTAMLDAGNPMFGVQITFNVKEQSKLSAKNIGDRITVKGICSGFLTDVIVKDAVLIK
ncbi:MAG: OB-fold protein [Flavobacteriales bacterium]